MKAAFATLLVLGLGGCAGLTAEPWPEAGAGGYAELAPIEDARLAALADRLSAVADDGASGRAAADFARAESLLTRARREAAAGLDLDAASDSETLDETLTRIERTMMTQRRVRGSSAR